ncbi:MAG: hypothetical protein FJ029_08090 [Actinobacteria bacterium]|nr:hypothetical protein [Actinomycetota bacterium]
MTQGAEQRERHLRQRDLLRFFLPLGASSLLMSIGQPLPVAAVGRLPNQAVMLAALGVAQSLVQLIEGPGVPILQTATRLSADAAGAMFARRFMRRLVFAMTAVAAVLFLTPVRRPILTGVMGLPPETADAAEPVLMLFVIFPALPTWRQFYQGVMIRHGYSDRVALSTIGRLAVLVAVLASLVATGALPGAAAAAVASLAAQATDASLGQTLARPAWRRALAIGGTKVWSAGRMWRFYAPLAMTGLMVVAARPMLIAGIGRAGDASVALAAWPAVISIVNMVVNLTGMVQSMAIAKIEDGPSLRAMVRFVLTIGGAISALLAMAAFTPVGRVLVTGGLGIVGPVADTALIGLRLMAPVPLVIAGNELLRGMLVRTERTPAIRLATMASIASSATLLFGLLAVGGLPGVLVGAIAYVGGLALEFAVLVIRSMPVIRPLCSQARAAGA